MFNKSKDTVQTFRCPKCGFQKYIINNSEHEQKCKVCGNQMTLSSERPYNSNNGLEAIKYSNKMSTNRSEIQKPIVTCPYCKSTNTNKITTTSKVINTALWGIFGTRRYKNYHCNNCGSDF